jgi:hypothetical protein
MPATLPFSETVKNFHNVDLWRVLRVGSVKTGEIGWS